MEKCTDFEIGVRMSHSTGPNYNNAMTSKPSYLRRALNRLRAIASAFKRELRFYRLVMKHPKTPWLPKVLLGLTVAYALCPFDLIPDFIPVLGYLDDVVIIPGLVLLSLRLIPKQVLSECREMLGAAD